MLQRELIDSTQIEDGVCLDLYRHGRDVMIVLGRNELMSTRMRFSEEQLAQLTIERLGKDNARLLIGGYGMGFTLRAALRRLGPKGWACVVELVPGIIEWARGPMAELADGCLDDPRSQLVMGDVGAEIARKRGAWDAILLDVDNGPDGLTRDANNGLYTMRGLEKARAALAPGGVLAVWSAGPDPAFTRRMRDAGFAVEEVQVRARSNGKGPRHVIWFGTKR